MWMGVYVFDTVAIPLHLARTENRSSTLRPIQTTVDSDPSIIQSMQQQAISFNCIVITGNMRINLHKLSADQ